VQLDSKTEKITSLSPGRGTLTNKRVPVPNEPKQPKNTLKAQVALRLEHEPARNNKGVLCGL